MKLYFYDKVLVYADIFGLDSYFYENELLDFDVSLAEAPKGTVLDAFIEMEPITMGLANLGMRVKNIPFLMTPQMNQDDQMVIVNYVFIEDIMNYAFATNYDEIKDGLSEML